jgi:transcription initiation factor TFIID subunit 6
MLLKDASTDEGVRKQEADKVIGVILAVLTLCQDDRIPLTNGYSAVAVEELQSQLAEKVGDLVASKILESGQVRLAHAMLGKR